MMKIRVIHEDGSVTTLNNSEVSTTSSGFLVEKLYFLDSKADVGVFKESTGHWIVLENWIDIGKRVKCSKCGQVFVLGDDVSRHYCSNCGCHMIDLEESEDIVGDGNG